MSAGSIGRRTSGLLGLWCLTWISWQNTNTTKCLCHKLPIKSCTSPQSRPEICGWILLSIFSTHRDWDTARSISMLQNIKFWMIKTSMLYAFLCYCKFLSFKAWFFAKFKSKHLSQFLWWAEKLWGLRENCNHIFHALMFSSQKIFECKNDQWYCLLIKILSISMNYINIWLNSWSTYTNNTCVSFIQWINTCVTHKVNKMKRYYFPASIWFICY